MSNTDSMIATLISLACAGAFGVWTGGERTHMAAGYLFMACLLTLAIHCIRAIKGTK